MVSDQQMDLLKSQPVYPGFQFMICDELRNLKRLSRCMDSEIYSPYGMDVILKQICHTNDFYLVALMGFNTPYLNSIPPRFLCKAFYLFSNYHAVGLLYGILDKAVHCAVFSC
jgi:hypothetical protein